MEWGGQTGLLEGDEKGNANAEKATTWSEGITLLSRFADLCVKNPKEAVKDPDKKLTGEESFYLDSDKAGKISFTLSEVMKMTVKEDIYSHTSHRGFVTEKVAGVSLTDFFESVGLSGDVVITVKTTDGFGNSRYENISLSDLTEEDYLIAFEVDGEQVFDVDLSGNESCFRLYRHWDDGSTSANYVKYFAGITVSGGEVK